MVDNGMINIHWHPFFYYHFQALTMINHDYTMINHGNSSNWLTMIIILNHSIPMIINHGNISMVSCHIFFLQKMVGFFIPDGSPGGLATVAGALERRSTGLRLAVGATHLLQLGFWWYGAMYRLWCPKKVCLFVYKADSLCITCMFIYIYT